MTPWYEWLHVGLRTSHIVIGCIGLAVFWLVIGVPKGTGLHRRLGRVFVASALFVGGSALVSSTWALLHPLSFAPGIATLAPERQAAILANVQFLFAILWFLSVATIAGALYGWHSVKLKANVAALRRTSLPFWQSLAVVASAGLFCFGAYHLVTGTSKSDMPLAAYWVPTLLGMVGFFTTIIELRSVYRPLQHSREWLYRHIEQMFGTGIAFHTAFLVFGARRVLEKYLEGPLFLVPWIAPFIIGVIATKWYIGRLKRQAAAGTAPPMGVQVERS